MWRSEDNLTGVFLFFPHVGPGNLTQVFGIGIKYLYLLSHLISSLSLRELHVESFHLYQ